MQRNRILAALFASTVAATALIACTTSRAAEPPPLAVSDDIDALVEGALAEIGVPAGVAVAVYTPDGVYARGFGLADVDTGEPATADTAFYIASTTKAFTAMTMNALAHRGEIDLDATLAEFAPDAPFPAAVHPDEVVLRDLLTHTSGISNQPIGFRSAYSGDHTPELLWELLGASVENEAAPHGTFQYTNTGYNILTVLTDRELGVRWQDLIAREILEPAGMSHTTAVMSEAERGGWSIARPHGPDFVNGGMRKQYLGKVDATMQSAGGMVMSANDALKWLELLINDGVVDGRQVIPAEAVRESRERLAEIGALQARPFPLEAYGLGWFVSTYSGEPMIFHRGGFAGFLTHISYLPERGVGVAVFADEAIVGASLSDALASSVYDLVAGRIDGGEAREARIAELAEGYQSFADRYAADLANRAGREWLLTLPREAYAGAYVNDEQGTFDVAVEGDELVVRMNILHAVAEPFTQPDSIRVELAPMSGGVIVFEVEDGVVTGATMQGMPAAFERR